MAVAKFDIKTVQTEAQKTAQRAFHAGVGVTDLAVEFVRDYAADAQRRAQKLTRQQLAAAQKLQQELTTRVAGLQKTVTTFEPQAVRVQATKDAKARRAAMEKRVAGLRDEALTVPGRAQHALDANVATASAAYDDLVKRGEILVGRIRRQQSTQETLAAADTTVAKAKTTKTQATKAAKATKKAATTKRAATRSGAKATGTSAKKTTSAGSRALADGASKVGD